MSSRNVKKSSPFVSEPSTGIPTFAGGHTRQVAWLQQRQKPKLLSLTFLQGEVSSPELHWLGGAFSTSAYSAGPRSRRPSGASCRCGDACWGLSGVVVCSFFSIAFTKPVIDLISIQTKASKQVDSLWEASLFFVWSFNEWRRFLVRHDERFSLSRHRNQANLEERSGNEWDYGSK